MMRSTEELDVEETTEGPRMFREQNQVRYLKGIAIFKMTKGLFLLCLGVSLLFLNTRTRWLDSISDWATDELLVVHSKTLHYLLNQLQKVLINGHLRATGVLSLFSSAVLFTEGIGVYLQKRWAELLMVFATSALIPLEVHHLFVKPGVVASVILAANCFIVWFLYRVLRRKPPHRHVAVQREMAKVG